MNTLLFCKEVFDEYCFTRGERDLTDDEREQIARRRQEMQRITRDKEVRVHRFNCSDRRYSS